MINSNSLPKTFVRDGVVILLLALLLRIPFFIISSSQPAERQHAEDTRGYVDLAHNLNQGLGFGRYLQTNDVSPAVWIPELCRTPGFPWVVARLDREPTQSTHVTVLFQQVIELALCWVVFAICYFAFGRVPGLIAGVFMALDLQGVTLANMVLSEMTFTALFIAAALTATQLSKKNGLIWAAVTGLLIGASVLVRPTTLYLGGFIGVVLVALALWRKRWVYLATAVILVGATYAPVVAWMARNKAQCGAFSLTTMTQSGALGQAGSVLARAKGIPLNDALEEVCNQANVSFWQIRFVPISTEQKKRLAEVAVPIVRAHPKEMLKEYVIRTANLMVGPEKYMLTVLGMPPISFGLVDKSNGAKKSSNGLGLALLGVQVLFTLAIYVGVLRTLWQAVRGRVFPGWVWICFWFSMYTLGISAAVCVGDPRYRWPTIPLLIMVAAASFIRPQTNQPASVGVEEKTSAAAAAGV
ncbi:MAG TPA: glycosyltransferase family 39 protein [Verrucomicrobiae bacterium]|nr:glycosyltransferase family 39 protein [Verrucomicrobiae bacterium]